MALTPLEADVAFVVGGPTEGVAGAPRLVGDEPARYAREVLALGRVGLERAGAGVLQIRLVFVHEAPAAAVDDDPAHRDVAPRPRAGHPVRQALSADAVRIGRIRVLEGVRAAVIPH